MRILHTSDWHVGKVWKQRKRLDEMARVLDHLADFVERERIDLVLMSGDVFDTPVPPAEAERMVFAFFKRIGLAGTESVLIAGNHDSPARLAAWGQLSELVRCHVVARPANVGAGGTLELDVCAGQRAVIAALPFAGVRQLLSGVELVDDAHKAKEQTYPHRMAQVIRHLSGAFRPDAVNLFMAHTFVDGAIISRSERMVHVGDEWAIDPQALPKDADYIALGHVHKPQTIDGIPAIAHYAGSPLQLDFNEVNEDKHFLVIEAEPGVRPTVEAVPYEGGRPLVDLRATLEEIERDAEALGRAGWIRVTVPLTAPDPDLATAVRRLLPNAVVVKVELPEQAANDDSDRPPPGAPAAEVFSAYYRRHHERAPAPELLAAFRDLYDEETEDEVE